MAAISWSQVDTNGSGYVDGTEAVTAKAKGVKNVWNNMTETDYMTNITREQKLTSLRKKFAPPERFRQWISNNYISIDLTGSTNQQEEVQRMREEDKKNKEEKLLNAYAEYEQYCKSHADELEKLDSESKFWSTPFKKAKTALLDLCNEKLGTNFDTLKNQDEINCAEKAQKMYNAITHVISNMKANLMNLVEEVDAFYY